MLIAYFILYIYSTLFSNHSASRTFFELSLFCTRTLYPLVRYREYMHRRALEHEDSEKMI